MAGRAVFKKFAGKLGAEAAKAYLYGTAKSLISDENEKALTKHGIVATDTYGNQLVKEKGGALRVFKVDTYGTTPHSTTLLTYKGQEKGKELLLTATKQTMAARLNPKLKGIELQKKANNIK